MRRLLGWLTVALSAGTYCGMPARAQERPAVGMVLVLAVDMSASVDSERWTLQQNGYVAAFRNPAVLESILAAAHGAIAVTLVQWSGDGEQKTVIDWQIINSRESAEQFATRIEYMPREFSGNTCIAGAIQFSVKQAIEAPFETYNRTVDISGDGTNDCTLRGKGMPAAREHALENNVQINGLAIQNPNEHQDIFEYYQDEVIAGSDAFALKADGYERVGEALARKLQTEIAFAAK